MVAHVEICQMVSNANVTLDLEVSLILFSVWAATVHIFFIILGSLCELDTNPCASSPCLYSGKCIAKIGGDFGCECPYRYTGKRCEYGQYCYPNPCKHGGVCEEGDDGPLCKCRSYTGERCEFDLNECESTPCQNGGTCINEIGGFHCICPPNTTGTFCGNPTYSNPMSSTILNISREELIALVGGAILIILVIFIYCLCTKCRRSRGQQRPINNETRKEEKLNSMTEFKRNSKLSNLEVNQRTDIPAMCSPRPLSYTSSSQNDQLYNCNNVVLNNLDTLRSYGSAG